VGQKPQGRRKVARLVIGGLDGSGPYTTVHVEERFILFINTI
jgi:hypothetical protein